MTQRCYDDDYSFQDEDLLEMLEYSRKKHQIHQQRLKNKSGVEGAHNGDNSNHDHHQHHHVGGGGGGDDGDAGAGGEGGSSGAGGVGNSGDNILNEKANEYVRDCLTEKSRMDRKFPIAERLIDCEIEKVQSTGRIPMRELKYADIYREKPMRLSQKVLVPVREHPKFNFVGKLLGPKGNSLRRLQEETLCKMTVLGRNSMRDRLKEEELRASKDPKYAHLSSDLHVEISTIAPPAEAYARIAYAMAELRKYLIPDSNDIIRQEQLRELMDNTSISGGGGGVGVGGNDGSNLKATTAVASYKRLNAHTPGGGIGSISNPNTGTAITGGIGLNKPHQTHHTGYRAITQQTTQYNKNSNAPKQKVMSILEKARTAMDETYGRGYEDHMVYEPHTNYDSYAYGHISLAHTPHLACGGIAGITGGGNTTRGPNYDNVTDYDPGDYGRRGGGVVGGNTDYYHQHSPGYNAGNTTHSQGASLNPNANHNRGPINR